MVDMQFIGLRHGQSIYNLKSLCNDDPTKPVNLTDEGRRQAQSAADTLAGKTMKKIYSSPLPRAIQTSDIVNVSLKLPISVEPRLADIRSGFDGLPVDDYVQAIAADPVNMKVNDGESQEEYHQRVIGFLEELKNTHEGLVLLVVHEETLRTCKAWCDDLHPADVLWLPFENCLPYYLCWLEII